MEEVMVQQEKQEISNPFMDSKSFQSLYDIGKMWASSSLIPAAYQGKPMDCTIAVDMANRMGVSPMMVMQNLYVVKGNPQWSGQACMSLIKGDKKFHTVHYVYTGERGTDTWGCYVSAIDRSTGEEVRGPEVTIKMVKDEGWFSKKDKYGNETSKWKTMPELMLAYRAAAFFARIHIPNTLMGCKVEGEIEDIAVDKPETVNPFAVEDKKEEVLSIVDQNNRGSGGEL